MIRETAELTIDPARETAFLAAAAPAVPIFRAAAGCRAMQIERVIEPPGLYRLQVLWDTLEHHTVTFRGSQGFADWRALVGPYFIVPPRVDHAEVAVPGFGG